MAISDVDFYGGGGGGGGGKEAYMMGASVVRRPHFRTGISLQAATRSQPNFICSMFLVRIACICILGKLLQNFGYYGNW